ncbi:MAG: 2-oxoglutarate dehydrogenase E1 component [Pseudomonadota bacterium]|nr:2-oxoglutarate dehydrogenase E1 component [Pseudomonadota bacterium]
MSQNKGLSGTKNALSAQQATTALWGGNSAYIEELYERYLAGEELPADWRKYFAALPGAAGDTAHGPLVRELAQRAQQPRVAAAGVAAPQNEKQAAVSRLIQIYMNRGHLIAKVDPLGLMERPKPKLMELAYMGLGDEDLDTEFYTASRVEAIPRRAKLRDIIALLEQVFAGTIGAEFAHVSNTDERLWLQDQFLAGRAHGKLSNEERVNILRQLTAAEGLERFLHTRYVGQKRFSLEGGDSFIPMLNDLVQQGGQMGVEEFVIGMAHRGRLSVLVNVLGKSPADLFSEFEGRYDIAHLKGSGDVKYHKGFSSDLRTPGGNVHVALAFNPSHLEVVNPVVEGSVRARQERRGADGDARVVPVLVHGDSAFAGQGVVMETLQLSQARAFYTGGTVHMIINNQIGFTTSDPRDTRSTMYCSDVAKMLEAPIFHVNADDPEAVVFVTRQALAYRMKFRKDVVIDLVCYRRLGHNEADEPAATQPVMYSKIRQHPTVRQIYAAQLAAQGVISQKDADAFVEEYRAGLDAGKSPVPASLGLIGNQYTVDWTRFLNTDWSDASHTAIDAERLAKLGPRTVEVPEGVKLHPRVEQVYANRRKMLAGEMPLDWGCAEILAYASLLEDGCPIRITGQDSGRGTFFHRHAVLHNQNDGSSWVPLQHMSAGQPRFVVTDSVLSEEAVLGFEYGYSTTNPAALVIWEAQFGDFVNGAQVIIDQFISSGESKWGRLCGLAMFLPHGYEGQGPEHSSARLERFLQMCAENNMQVVVPSTPAQMFHMLRRQMLRSLRKPLVVMTPKSLLRHELSVSRLEDLTNGGFSPVIDEVDAIDAAQVRRVVFCSGKVYFDLLKARRAARQENVALVRIEQLYPFPTHAYEAVLKRYPQARQIVWCQEEPQNQGAWYQIRHRLEGPLQRDRHTLLYAGRQHAAAPATGIAKIHDSEQRELVDAALNATALDIGPSTARLVNEATVTTLRVGN